LQVHIWNSVNSTLPGKIVGRSDYDNEYVLVVYVRYMYSAHATSGAETPTLDLCPIEDGIPQTEK